MRPVETVLYGLVLSGVMVVILHIMSLLLAW